MIDRVKIVLRYVAAHCRGKKASHCHLHHEAAIERAGVEDSDAKKVKGARVLGDAEDEGLYPSGEGEEEEAGAGVVEGLVKGQQVRLSRGWVVKNDASHNRLLVPSCPDWNLAVKWARTRNPRMSEEERAPQATVIPLTYHLHSRSLPDCSPLQLSCHHHHHLAVKG
jgi:hypothetical protein